MTLVLVAFGTLLLTVIALNFSTGEKKIDKEIVTQYSVHDPEFRHVMSNLLGPAILPGNRATALTNGDEIFPAMLAAIRSARHTITFETFIYWSGDIGQEFSDALSERARAGVKVHVLLDWVGSVKMQDAYMECMRAAGVHIRKYHPLRWYTLARLNNRTHRKLLVVDGRVGFTGGVGIADTWLGHAQWPDHWRDSHYRIEGPVVAQMQAAFMDNWMKTTGEVLSEADYFPPLQPVGDQLAQVFKSSQGEGAESVRLMYLLSIAAARQTIDIGNAYFVPDDLAVETLVAALKRGVRVRLVLPGKHTDSKFVRGASRARWGKVLEAGAEIYEYQPALYHCKIMIVDGVWVSVGSTNFDSRSFRLNDEANLNIYDRDFAAQQLVHFDNDVLHSRRVTYEEWQNRPWLDKILEHGSALFRSQL